MKDSTETETSENSNASGPPGLGYLYTESEIRLEDRLSLWESNL